MSSALVAFVQRHGRGLWGLALLSAVIAPVALHCAALHRGHWFPGPTIDFWARFGAWAAQAWGLIGVIAAAGWVAGAAPQTPGATRWIRVSLGLRVAALGWGVWVAAAIPGFIWTARLGVPGVFEAVVPAAGVVGIAAVIAGALASWRAFAGLVAGIVIGPALLWAAA